MKLTQQLLSISEESAVAKSAQQQADLLKAHQKAKKVSADQGVVQHVNKDKNTGRIYASDWYDDDETIASYNNGKFSQGPVKEEMVPLSKLKPGMKIRWVEDGDEKIGTITADPKYNGGMRIGGRSVKNIFDQGSTTELTIIKEAAESEDKEERQTADQLEVGDEVEITGNVEFQDSIGTIERFGEGKKFVVVKMSRGGALHSFHSSDVSAASSEHEEGVFDDDEDNEDEDEKDEDTFYVAFYDEDEHQSWIGCVTKAHGGKWHEERYKGKPDYRWGTSYMSYLKPHEVMQWIHKDYRRGMEIEGPFDDPKDAEEYVTHNWGELKEGVEMSESLQPAEPGSQKDRAIKAHNAAIKAGKEGTLKICPIGYHFNKNGFCIFDGEQDMMGEAMSYTDFDDWKQAVLHSYPAQAKKIKFKGRMEGGKDTISAEVPGEDRSYGVWDQDKENGVVLSEDANDDMLAKFMSELKAANIKASLLSGGKLEFNANDNDAVWNIYSKYMQKFRNAGWTATNIERSPGNPTSRYLKLLKPGITEAVKQSDLKKAQSIFKRDADADMDYEDVINLLTDEGFSEEVAHEVAIDNGRVAPKGWGKKITEAAKDMIEAHGIKGMKREPWRKTFKNEEAMVAWAEKYDAEIYGQRATDYAEQLNKNNEHAGEEIKEGMVDSVKGFVKHQTNMAKANSRGWNTFGKGMAAAIKDRNETDPAKKAENERVVKQSVRDSNRYRDFADGGKGFNSTKRTTAEQDWDGKVDKVKDVVKGAADTVKRFIKVPGKTANERLKDRAGELVQKEKDRGVKEGISPFKPNARVKIVSGPKDVVGKEGTIGEVVTNNGQKSYTVDYDHDYKSDKPNFGAKSVRLQPKDIKLIRDTKVKESKGDGEQLEVINKAHADTGAPKKVFFTGNREECKEFMRTHKSLKMDLMYKDSGRLASYVL